MFLERRGTDDLLPAALAELGARRRMGGEQRLAYQTLVVAVNVVLLTHYRS
jgi:hypothetical protein